MPITPQQKENRRKHIGASEVAAVLGLSPYRTPYDVWLEKTGKITDTDEETEAAGLGNMIEGPLLDWGAAELGVTIIKNQQRVHPGGVLMASHDSLITGKAESIEAKTAGIANPQYLRLIKDTPDDWGREETDEVPRLYYIQGQAQAAVSTLAVVHFAALVAGRGRLLYHVPADPQLIDIILTRCTEFWVKCVQADTPPDGTYPTPEIGRLRVRVPGKVMMLPAGPIAAFVAAKAQAKAAAEAAESAEGVLLASMADAEAAQDADGLAVKIIKSHSTWFDAETLKTRFPEAANEARREKPYCYPRAVKKL